MADVDRLKWELNNLIREKSQLEYEKGIKSKDKEELMVIKNAINCQSPVYVDSINDKINESGEQVFAAFPTGFGAGSVYNDLNSVKEYTGQGGDVYLSDCITNLDLAINSLESDIENLAVRISYKESDIEQKKAEISRAEEEERANTDINVKIQP